MTVIATKPNATGSPGYNETLPCKAKSASQARQLVCAALNTWQLSHLIDDGQLIVSELVANAVQHSHCHSVRVSVERPTEDRVRVAVSDKSRTKPAAATPSVDEEAGRGLLLVDSVADDWGVDYRAWGKVVWAELRAEGSA
ncbi:MULTISPECIES: ATP-binding protein [Streptomyces]|uniref:ATP-binding protein n=1 Tax=Streptomyces TaxID=1883 RepID=UPI001E53EA27|nr:MULTISPECIES: ATP-binding protein [Streptomyces]UFQ16235.1 ATP-binding protein [Streptomyces huasconensis]WCL85839.1 ATP-binding protein [Streptomyces sp. JCM 35825]